MGMEAGYQCPNWRIIDKGTDSTFRLTLPDKCYECHRTNGGVNMDCEEYMELTRYPDSFGDTDMDGDLFTVEELLSRRRASGTRPVS